LLRYSNFKIAAVRHVGFLDKNQFMTADTVRGVNMRHCQISCRSVKQLRRYGRFSVFQDGGYPPSCMCCTPSRDHAQGVVGGLYRCAKFGWNRQSSFEDMRVSISCQFGLKMPIHKWGVLESKIRENGNFCSFILLGMP